LSLELAKARFTDVKFAEFLGASVVEAAPGRVVLAVPPQPKLINAGGRLSGGASASLLNMAGTFAAWTGIDLAAEPHLGCVDMSVRYLAAAADGQVVAEAQVLHRGRDLFFLDLAARDRDGKSVCQGLMTYRAPDYAGRSPRLWVSDQSLSAPTPTTPPGEPWLFRGYVQKLHISPVHQIPGRVRLHMPCTAVHMDEREQMHAGALASIVDIAGTAAAWSLVPRRQGARGSTLGLHVSYTCATADSVVADAHVEQRSEELFFSTVRVSSVATGQLVATGQVSYRLLEPR
jgi:acyl-coenzyme A thioesterase 13